jgi:hypothetical protein
MKLSKYLRHFYDGDAGAPAGGAPAGTPAAAPAAAPSDWTSSLNDDNKGYVQNKGFKDPAMVLDSYRGMEKLLGKKEQIILKPEKADDVEGWNEFYNKAGRPEKADAYDLGLPKEGTDENFAKWAKDNFHKAGLNQNQAAMLAKEYAAFSAGLIEKNTTDNSAILQQAEIELKKTWGAAFDQNKSIAEKALVAFGVQQDDIAKLEAAMGPVALAKLFHGIGSRLGEDSFIQGTRSQGVLTPEAAMNKITELRNDKNFVARFGKGDSEAIAELNKLHQWAYV